VGILTWRLNIPRLPGRGVSARQHRGSFDFRQIREHAAEIARDIERRKADGDVHKVVALYNEYCAMTEALQQLRAARNDSAAKFAQALQAKADKAQVHRSHGRTG